MLQKKQLDFVSYRWIDCEVRPRLDLLGASGTLRVATGLSERLKENDVKGGK